MKSFSLLVFVALCGSAFSTSTEEFLNKHVTSFKEMMDERATVAKLKAAVLNVCPGKELQFQRAYIKMRDCIQAIDMDEETMCSYLKNHVEQCSSPIISMLEECLPEKARDTPRFFIKSVVSSINYICKIDGEHLIELSNPCIYNESPRMRRCLMKTRSKMQQYASTLPSKTEICEFLTSTRYCLKAHLNMACRHPITKEAFMGIYDSNLQYCETNNNDYDINEVESY